MVRAARLLSTARELLWGCATSINVGIATGELVDVTLACAAD
jgi:hypothetical protein